MNINKWAHAWQQMIPGEKTRRTYPNRVIIEVGVHNIHRHEASDLGDLLRVTVEQFIRDRTGGNQ